MKKFIKIISLALVLILTLSIFPSCGDSEEETFVLPTRDLVDNTEYTSGLYKYYLFDDDTVVIKEYTGNEAEVVIPDTLDGHKVVALASGAFYRNTTITSVTIPNTVETIGSSAFNGCMNLANVKISENAWEILPNVFTDTPYIEKFKNEEFVILGDSVLVQYNGNSSNVVIPENVKHIGSAFTGSETIKSVTLHDRVFTIGSEAFAGSSISRVEGGKNLVFIGYSAFNYCPSLYYIELSDSLKKIDDYAFVSCYGLKYLKLGKGIEYIGYEAFYSTSNLKYVYLPKSLLQKNEDGTYKTTIDERAFYDSGVKYVFFEGTEAEFEALGVKGAHPDLYDANKTYEYNY